MPKLTAKNETANGLSYAHSLQKVHCADCSALEFGGLTPFALSITHLTSKRATGEVLIDVMNFNRKVSPLKVSKSLLYECICEKNNKKLMSF